MKLADFRAVDLPVPQAKSLASDAWPYLIVILLLSPSVYWIAQDHSVWPWDQAWYGEVSTDLWFTFVNSPREWWPAMWRAFGSKAPGIAWVGQWFVPIGRILGSIELGLLLSIIVTQFGTLFLIYKLGKEVLSDRGFAFLGCLMLISAPLFVAMSRQYFAEPLQLFAVTYIYWIASRAHSLRRVEFVGHLLLASGLGFASKVTFPIYCFIPACIAVYEMTMKEAPPVYSSSSFKKVGLLTLAGIGLLANVIVWYARNGSSVFDFVRLASSSNVALHYGSSGDFPYKLKYWVGALQKSLAVPSVLLSFAIVFLIATGVLFTNSERRRVLPCKRLSLLAVAAFMHVVLVLTTLALNVNEEQRYLLPLLPSVVVIFLWCVSFVRMRVVFVMLTLLFTGQWAYVESRAFGFVPLNESMSHWVLPLQSNKERMNELNRIIELTCTPKTTHRFSIVGVELPWLNYNSMSFYAEKWKQDTKLQCYYVSLGYAETDPLKAWKRINDLKIKYYISLTEEALTPSPDFINQVSLPILEQIRTDARFTPVPYHSNYSVIIFQSQY